MNAPESPIALAPTAPRVWLLTGPRPGDNNQVLGLGEMLGWPFQIKRLVYHAATPVPKMISSRLANTSIAGLNRRASSPLMAPWPDVVISAGRDVEPIARWIKKQSRNRTRLVHMGRPWSPLDRFDLIISTPQYFLPERPNVLTNQLPLHRVTQQRLTSAAAKWQPLLEHLPRPYTTVLVGGNSGSFVFTPEKGRRLGRLVDELVHSAGGSVLITNSARTADSAFDALLNQLSMPRHVYRWANQSDENPYFGYLALADRVVITGESVSMLAEAGVTAKPLHIFDLAERNEPGDPAWKRLSRKLDYRSLRDWCAVNFGAPHMQRDIGAIQRLLVSNGRATWLGKEPACREAATVSDAPALDFDRSVSRVHQLVYGALSC